MTDVGQELRLVAVGRLQLAGMGPQVAGLAGMGARQARQVSKPTGEARVSLSS